MENNEKLLAGWLEQLEDLPGPAPIAVAYSGGVDSGLLLWLACRKYGAGRVCAIHVNHNMQQASQSFEEHCRQQAAGLGCGFEALHVQAVPLAGESPEQKARDLRYGALAQSCSRNGFQSCLLGQHADDQLETLLLGLSRGWGAAGLCGMGGSFERQGARFARPLLGRTRAEIEAAAKAFGIEWIEDPSNKDGAYTRNKIRMEATPALVGCLPSIRESAARSMGHLAEAAQMLSELAEIDLGDSLESARLPLPILRDLSDARAKNALSRWAKQTHGCHPAHAQIEEALKQIKALRPGKSLAIKFGHGELQGDSNGLGFAPGAAYRPSRPRKP